MRRTGLIAATLLIGASTAVLAVDEKKLEARESDPSRENDRFSDEVVCSRDQSIRVSKRRMIEACTALIPKTTDKNGLKSYHFERAYAYFAKEEYESAVADFSKLIELSDHPEDAYDMRALAYEKLGRTQEAKADRLKLVEKAPCIMEWRRKAIKLGIEEKTLAPCKAEMFESRGGGGGDGLCVLFGC
jgi:tetratricopeptide (TPR) repeat protein